MAITSVQTLLPTTVSPEKGRAGKPGAGSSAFNTLLSSLGTPQAESTPEPQLAAAELLLMEMMQNSLALFGAAEADRPSGLQGMESLLSCLAGKNAAVAGSRSGRAGGGASLHPEQVGAGGPAAGADQIEGIGRTAAQFIGTPYRFGGEGAEGIDCSSFVQQVFQEHHIALP